MTIEQIQAAIDAKADARQIINMIADYIQANPGGGGGLTLYSGDGTLAGDRTVELNGKDLYFSDSILGFLLYLDQSGFASQLRSSNGTANSSIDLISDSVGGTTSFDLRSADGVGGQVRILGNAITSTFTYTANFHVMTGVTVNTDLVTADFANDAAAAVGNIPVGGQYHTAGVVKVRLA